MDSERESRLAELLLEALDRPENEQRAFLEHACGDDRELLDEALDCLALQDDLGDFLEQPAGLDMIGWSEAGPADHGLTAAEHEGLPRTTRFDRQARGQPAAESTESSRPERPSPDPVGAVAQAATSTVPGMAAWHDKLGKRRLGAYRIVGLVGEGGMGQVYVGEDERLGREVAIKIVPREMADRGDLLERFEREARALAALNHPNIVTIHSIEQDADIRFLTMELVHGRTLLERMVDGPVPVDEILDIALDLSSALTAAHRRGIIHRDLKPANVMLTDDGRIKILDFGIAKLTALGPSQATMDGMVIGTVAYMAPEQLEARPIDARTDLFALGMLLFETATGEHPFPTRDTWQRAKAILNQKPADVRSMRPELPPKLGAIIHRLLEKAPAKRYQDADALRRDLAELRQTRQAEKILETRGQGPSALRRGIIVLALLVPLVLTATFLRRGPEDVASTTVTEADAQRSKTSLAVFSFRNLTDDPELAWLSEGIAELLVTDLAQSPDLKVLARSEVHRLRSRADAEPAAELGPGAVRAIAEDGDLQVVVRGSYARLGDVLSITYLVEDPRGGRVLRSASFEGIGTESFFDLVDRLGSSVLEAVGASRPELSPATVEQATTSSVVAWQAYVEGLKLYHETSETEAAIARLDAALELDPDFALAAVSAAKMHQSLGRGSEAQAYSRRAIERVDHLPLRTRFKVEGDYYGSRWTTLGRAIETYTVALKVYPGHAGWHNNLARRYAFFERYPEALEEFDRAIDASTGFWGNVYGAANVHAAEGDYEAGGALLRAALAPDSTHWMLGYAMAWHLTDWGRLDQAAAAFDELEPRRPGSVRIPYGRWRLALLRDDWPEADRHARRLLEIDDSFARWRGHVALARNALFGGRASEALAHFDDAITASSGADRALARCFKAELQLTLGNPRRALDQARLARGEGAGQWPELRGIFLAARAEQALGRSAAADRYLAELQARWRRQPNAVEERQLLHLTGLLALARGDVDTGRNTLERAAALLPARGVEFSWHVFPDHVPLWVDLGEVELTAGRPTTALDWLGRARAVGTERLEQPIPFVRGLYLAGVAAEAAGSSETARHQLERFLAYWAEGELHREDLSDARSRIAANG